MGLGSPRAVVSSVAVFHQYVWPVASSLTSFQGSSSIDSSTLGAGGLLDLVLFLPTERGALHDSMTGATLDVLATAEEETAVIRNASRSIIVKFEGLCHVRTLALPPAPAATGLHRHGRSHYTVLPRLDRYPTCREVK